MFTSNNKIKKTILKKGLALALGGGSVRGYFHIGVLKALEEFQIPIKFIAGVSIGSLVGGLFAAGYSSDAIFAILNKDTKIKNIFTIVNPVLFNKDGIFSGKGLIKELNSLVSNKKIEELPIPFVCRAVDLYTFQEKIFDEGDFGTAIKSSCSIPGVFVPEKKAKNSILADGGVIGNVPLRLTKDYCQDIPILSSNLISYMHLAGSKAEEISKEFSNNFLHKHIPLVDSALRAYFLMQSQLTYFEHELYPPTLEVMFSGAYYPSVTNIVEVRDQLVIDGYEACKKELQKIGF